MLFVDANVFLRHLTSDHVDHSTRALAFFERVLTGEIIVTTSEAVIAEVVHVLSSRIYNVGRSEIVGAVTSIVEMPNMHIPHKEAYFEALACYGSSRLDFVDCLNIAHMKRQGITEIVSFDRDFDRFPGITRVEP